MNFLRLRILLRLCRPLVVLSMFGALVAALMLLFRTIDASAGSSEVRLVLDTNSPNLFRPLHEMKAGFEDGYASKPYRTGRGPLPALRASSNTFEVVADPQTPLLRYTEPSSWKRLALLYLGASNDYLSLAWIVFFGVGSGLLWRLLLDVTPASPFTFANARRLRWLGMLVLGLDFAEELSYLALRLLMPVFQVPGLADPLSHYVRLNTETTLPGWEVGLVLLIIAAVYQRGVELSREAELVI